MFGVAMNAAGLLMATIFSRGGPLPVARPRLQQPRASVRPRYEVSREADRRFRQRRRDFERQARRAAAAGIDGLVSRRGRVILARTQG